MISAAAFNSKQIVSTEANLLTRWFIFISWGNYKTRNRVLEISWSVKAFIPSGCITKSNSLKLHYKMSFAVSPDLVC